MAIGVGDILLTVWEERRPRQARLRRLGPWRKPGRIRFRIGLEISLGAWAEAKHGPAREGQETTNLACSQPSTNHLQLTSHPRERT